MTQYKMCPNCSHKALYWRKTYNGYRCNYCHTIYDKNFKEITDETTIKRTLSTFNRICIDCKESFVTDQPSRKRCSKCKNIKSEESKHSKKYTKICVLCKQSFITTYPQYIRCPKCAKIRKEQDTRKRYNVTCILCKQPFISHNKLIVTCDECKQKLKK